METCWLILKCLTCTNSVLIYLITRIHWLLLYNLQKWDAKCKNIGVFLLQIPRELSALQEDMWPIDAFPNVKYSVPGLPGIKLWTCYELRFWRISTVSEAVQWESRYRLVAKYFWGYYGQDTSTRVESVALALLFWSLNFPAFEKRMNAALDLYIRDMGHTCQWIQLSGLLHVEELQQFVAGNLWEKKWFV